MELQSRHRKQHERSICQHCMNKEAEIYINSRRKTNLYFKAKI